MARINKQEVCVTPIYTDIYQQHKGYDNEVDYYTAYLLNTQDYYPFGMLMPGRTFSNSGYRYGYNGQEWDNEITGVNGANYTATFWEYDSRLGRRWNLDPKPQISISYYACFANNPIGYNDILDDSVWVFATTLPMSEGKLNKALTFATHTFIIVKTNDGKMHYYAYGPKPDQKGEVSQVVKSQLIQIPKGEYMQDVNIYLGKDKANLKNKIFVNAPEGRTNEEFDQAVIQSAESFGNNPDIKYNMVTNSDLTANCNSLTSTILYKAGVSKESINDIEGQIPVINWGFGDIKPWNAAEQKAAVKKAQIADRQRIEETERISSLGGRWGEVGNR